MANKSAIGADGVPNGLRLSLQADADPGFFTNSPVSAVGRVQRRPTGVTDVFLSGVVSSVRFVHTTCPRSLVYINDCR